MNVVISVTLSIFVAAAYVAAVHMFRPDHLRGQDRNNLQVIHYRLRNVSVVTLLLCILMTLVVGCLDSSTSVYDKYKQLRVVPLKINETLWCLGSILILYCGPILDYLWNYNKYIKQDFHDNFTTISGFRDHIFAPLTEEIVFRSVTSVVLSPSFTDDQITTYSPLLFGIAHIHHGFEIYHVKNIQLKAVLMTVAFQTLYTTVFGMLANYIFFKYQSVWCSIVVHSICNLMGFPGLVQGPIAFKVAYYFLLPTGLYLFYSII